MNSLLASEERVDVTDCGRINYMIPLSKIILCKTVKYVGNFYQLWMGRGKTYFPHYLPFTKCCVYLSLLQTALYYNRLIKRGFDNLLLL